MTRARCLLSAFLTSVALVSVFSTHATSQPMPQGTVYRDSSVATIRIWIHPDSLAKMYRSDSLESDYEYPAEFAFDNGVVQDSVSRIGFRLRGNTSRYSKKKSFKVSFNTFESGRSFHDFEKLNLNGEHNDPCIIRAKICWDLFNAFGVPASRANHVRVYINGKYYGLYIDVEHVDENFVRSRFGNNTGNLYKCTWPADLTNRGTSPSAYQLFTSGGTQVYELHINDDHPDYADLASFITFLNTSSTATFEKAIETYVNVPGFLKVLAVDAAVGSWDDYWFNSNNYYLYHNTATGRFEFIPYDYDNTLGVWWTSVMAGVDIGTRNVLKWGHPTAPRPLATRLLGIEKYAGWYQHYLNRFFQELFIPSTLISRAAVMHTMITPAAEADTYRTLDYGYTIAQFHSAYTTAPGAHVPYGLNNYFSVRQLSALTQLTAIDIYPIIAQQGYTSAGTDSVTITAAVEDEAPGVTVTAVISAGYGSPATIAMFDDGRHGDGLAGDGVYGGRVRRPPSSASSSYAIRAQDATGNVSLDPSNAPTSLWKIPGTFVAGPLAINEFLASNSTINRDPAGERDDWIELMNISSSYVKLRGKFLTDNLSRPDKWELPDTTLAPGGMILIWADDQTEHGPLHAPFKLDKAGEAVGIFESTDKGFTVIDSVTYGPQETDISFGRLPDGSGAFTSLGHPTPDAPNAVTSAEITQTSVAPSFALYGAYPNPFNPSTVIAYQLPAAVDVRLTVYDMLGREVRVLATGKEEAGHHAVVFDAAGLASGTYIARLEAGTSFASRRCLLIK
jgi:hypothetical protein